jgi:Spy/CpxP family protein refolding chaperone
MMMSSQAGRWVVGWRAATRAGHDITSLGSARLQQMRDLGEVPKGREQQQQTVEGMVALVALVAGRLCCEQVLWAAIV